MADKEVTIKVSTEADMNNLNDLTEALDDTKNKAEELGDAFREAEAEVEELTEQLAQIELGEIDGDFDEVSAKLEEAGEKADALSDALNNIDGSGLDNASSSSDDLTAGLDNATQSANDLSESMGLIEGVMLMDVANQIGALGDSAEGMAQEMNTASITVGQLATNVGMAEPQMVSLINYISNATFPQEEAMAYVNALNQMGVSADKLGQSATNMDKINDATHIGYQSVMQLTQGLRAVGVEADNLPSAFNAIAYAQANVNGGASTLSMVLKRQASTINEYGLNVDQLVLIMQKLSEQGVQGMKMGSELSKVLKDNNGDLRAIEQQLGLTTGALSNASQVTGEYEGQLQSLADEEAEHKTWLDQINAAWEDFSLTLSPVLSPLASVTGLIGQAGSYAVGINGINQLAASIMNLHNTTGIFNAIKTSLMGVANGARTAMISMVNFARSLLASAVSAARSAATAFATLAKEVLLAGYNALKSAAMWVVEKAAVVASTIADYAAAAAQWALNIAMSANPIGILIIAIAALVAILGYLYFNNEQVRAALDGLGQTVMGVAQTIYDSLVAAIDWVISALQGLWEYIMTLGGLIPANVDITGNQIIDSIIKVIIFIQTLPLQLGVIFANMIAKTLGFGDNFVQNMLKAGSNAVSKFINQISRAPSELASELQRMINQALNFAGRIGSILWQAGVNAITGFLNGLGRHSPGIMQREFIAEINEMGERVPNESRLMVGNVSRLGKNVTDAFNPDLSMLSFGNVDLMGYINTNNNGSSGNAGGDTIINIYGDVDSEERVNFIVETIRKELNWNNITAGRTN